LIEPFFCPCQNSLPLYFLVASPEETTLVVLQSASTPQSYKKIDTNPPTNFWTAIKTGLGKSRPTTRTDLMATVRSHLYRRQKQPQIITNLFREQHVRYAA
jgi:hypothetical protein